MVHAVVAPISNLLVEGLDSPAGVSDPEPTLTWWLGGEVTDVEVAVIPTPSGIDPGWTCRLDPETTSLRYRGPALRPLTRYRWSVTVTTPEGRHVEESSFITGAAEDEVWAGACWIAGAPAAATHRRGATAVPQVWTEVEMHAAPVLALLYVAAGGYARPAVNGHELRDVELSPTFSDYRKRVHYRVYDVTDQLVEGRNRVDLSLGRGFYGMTNPSPPPAWEWHSAPWHDEPCVRAALHAVATDGSVTCLVTDGRWRSRRTATLYDDLYAGETYDESDPGVCTPSQPAAAVVGPTGVLEREAVQPIRVRGVIAPVHIIERVAGEYVVDFGRVVAGRVRLEVATPGTHSIVLRHAEKLDDSGLPDLAAGERYFSDGFQTDRCTIGVTDAPRVWHPLFTYHGFRYVHVQGWPEQEPLTESSLVAEILHTDVRTVGSFRCSDELLNSMHEAVVETVRLNLHGLPTDTPTFEKNGWTGDGMVAAELMLMNLDIEPLLVKWLDDIADSRDDDGRPAVIAPTPGWGQDYAPSPTWHSAYVLIPWWLYWYRGNRDVLVRHYEGMARYLRLEFSASSDGIANTVLNDWCSPETDAGGGGSPDDPRVSATAYLYTMLTTMERVAAAIGQDATEWASRAAGVAESFNRTFWDEEAGHYRGRADEGYRQTHNVLPLAFGLAPRSGVDRIVHSLVEDLRARDDHLNTGILGTKYLLPVLSRHGHADLALRIARQRTFPSWGYWFEDGSRTLWEHWKADSRSRAHYMFGTYDDWFFHHVLGVTGLEPGLRRVRIKPLVGMGLDHAEGTVPTVQGPVSIGWESDAEAHRLSVQLPPGCVAEVELAGSRETVRAEWSGGSHALQVRTG